MGQLLLAHVYMQLAAKLENFVCDLIFYRQNTRMCQGAPLSIGYTKNRRDLPAFGRGKNKLNTRRVHDEQDKYLIDGGYYHVQPETGALACDLCPRACVLKEGDRGFCFVRQNLGGKMKLTTYGRSTGFCVDPIEKKPLNHFYPGESVLSFGTAGCNLGCQFCQNWSISKSREIELLSESAMPEDIALAAGRLDCRAVAFTYNDPVIWAEYAIDTAIACHESDIKTIAVTAGYITDAARGDFYEHIDAANVDLKAFSEAFYSRVTLSHLAPVLDTLVWLKNESDVWFEVTNLIIPGENDSDKEFESMCAWFAENLGVDVPLHFTAFHPDFRMRDKSATPQSTLNKAYDIAQKHGLRYVYVGNVDDVRRQSTYCGECHKLLIERNWYEIGKYNIQDGKCRLCHANVPGVFGKSKGRFGRRRIPVSLEGLGT